MALHPHHVGVPFCPSLSRFFPPAALAYFNLITAPNFEKYVTFRQGYLPIFHYTKFLHLQSLSYEFVPSDNLIPLREWNFYTIRSNLRSSTRLPPSSRSHSACCILRVSSPLLVFLTIIVSIQLKVNRR